MRTEAELDNLHDSVVDRFPLGLSQEQFRIVTLESADDDGRLYPPHVADYMMRYSWLVSMMMAGFIDNWAKQDQPCQWFITEKGRKLLNQP